MNKILVVFIVIILLLAAYGSSLSPNTKPETSLLPRLSEPSREYPVLNFDPEPNVESNISQLEFSTIKIIPQKFDLEQSPIQNKGKYLGRFRLTFYYVTEEKAYWGVKNTRIKLCNGGSIKVRSGFAKDFWIEGTGITESGLIINYGGSSCALVLDPNRYPWGMGNHHNPLLPFISVATDQGVVRSGTILYVPEFKGLKIPSPGSGQHHGCVVVDDTGGAFRGGYKGIDFFVATRSNWKLLGPQLPKYVRVYANSPDCRRILSTRSLK